MRAVDLSNNNWPLALVDIQAQMSTEGDQLGAVILKATEGVTYLDPTYAAWTTQARVLGLPVVAYHCIWDTGNGAAQADWFLSHVKDADGLMLDWERFGPSVAQTPTVLAFMARVDLDPRPKFMYAAGWIFSWPGVTRAIELSRWPLITPDPSPTLPWTSMVLHQNPQGYYVVDGKSIDVDAVVDPGFFESFNKEAPVADFICTIGSDILAVSPGGVMPITQGMLGAYTGVPNLGNVTGTDTADRIVFYMQHGRWQLPNGSDPGPREAKSTSTVAGPSAADIAKAVNDDAARRMQA